MNNCDALSGPLARISQLSGKLTVFTLLPSTTSSSETLLCAEVGLAACLCHASSFCDKFSGTLCAVRLDDYLLHGHAILLAMVEQNKRVYPAEETASMLDMMLPAEVLGDDTGRTKSRFQINTVTNSYRAWVAQIVGTGIEQGEIRCCQEEVFVPLLREGPALPSLGPVVGTSLAPRAVHASIQRLVFVAFSDAAAAKYTKSFGVSVHACIGYDMVRSGPGSLNVEELAPEKAALFSEKQKAWLHICWKEQQNEAGWEPAGEDSAEEEDSAEDSAEGAARKAHREAAGIPEEGLDSEALDSLTKLINKAINTFNGESTVEALGGVFGDEAYPILVVEPDHVVYDPTAEAKNPVPLQFISDYRENRPDHFLAVLLVDTEYSSFTNNLWLIPAWRHFLEEVDAVIFATEAEVEQAASFFTKAKLPEEHVGTILKMQQVPFPCLHFFTMATALGQELDDSGIITPAVTVGGTGLSGLPLEKFHLLRNEKTEGLSWHHPYSLADQEWRPIVERTLAGVDGFAGATVVHPAGLIAKLLTTLLENFVAKQPGGPKAEGDEEGARVTWALAFGEAYPHLEDSELRELEDMARWLCHQYQHAFERGLDNTHCFDYR
eukprot:gnl/TRDRNA2_/TRDRNA2_175036_c1_seq5.p1 gnl/TRDRNA2_/TRDRNA2_175036_c1~~gnl/TRDRNA2_/TRDRNA2_175036_c1_seq5.p1  ORF type:complete len:608 (-),score=99.38 gnl/TRDRNA2_/TRDRNA2_175036_c1_seq5:529-2352(-)